MRKYGKVDDNQKSIVRALERAGATVESIASIGNGCADLIVGYRGVNYLLEVKDGSKPPSAQRLTDDEVRWHAAWRGSVRTVNCLEAALRAIGAIA